MKKERLDMEEFAAMVADKQDNPTLGELAKEFPNKTYKELENYRSEDRNEEANQIPLTEDQKKLVEHLEAAQTSLTESQQKQEELEPIGIGHNHPPEEEQRLKKEMGACITAGIKRDKEATELQKMREATAKIKELEESLANALAVNESHQKLNGKLQERATELEEENKKLHEHVNKQMSGARKAGL